MSIEKDPTASPEPDEGQLRTVRAEAACPLERVEELGLSLAAAYVSMALDALNSSAHRSGN